MMYIMKISKDSFKIILSREDLSKYGENVFNGGDISKQFFTDILTKLNPSYSGHSHDYIAHAEFFEDKFGGGELFICLYNGMDDKNVLVFESYDFEDIIGACKTALRFDSFKESKLILCQSVYYLLIYTSDKENYLQNYLKEFGKCSRASSLFIWHLVEHGKIIFSSNAVENTASYFSKHHGIQASQS